MPPLPSSRLRGHDSISLVQALQLVGSAGDLATGQPLGTAERAARLAQLLAGAAGVTAANAVYAGLVAQLRWAGSPAGAPGFAALLGDDIGARRALLADPFARRPGGLKPLADIQAEVAGELAALLGLPGAVEDALRRLSAHGANRPELAHIALLAGDLEILARSHGLETALPLLRRLAGRRYPASLVELAAPLAGAWLQELAQPQDSIFLLPAFLPVSAPLAPVADAIELKLPWLAGYARRVALLAQQAAQLAGLPDDVQRRLVRAALLHGLGRAGVPYPVWQGRARLEGAAREAVRRAPYCTALALGRIAGLEDEAALASQVYERLDGSGYYRSLDAEALGQPQRILAAAA
ncbi:HD-GYP domain-containing protein, partial [Massilia sp. DD77]|uniref:HD-GYP domain-containing protein n=1 Tax=Massilia sp. DD77 TaxID=3109349 RepID=UPI002FFEBF86